MHIFDIKILFIIELFPILLILVDYVVFIKLNNPSFSEPWHINFSMYYPVAIFYYFYSIIAC